MVHPQPHPAHFRRRILFVFAWLSAGVEMAELCRLARALDPARYRIGMLPCQRAEGSEEALRALTAAGVEVDTRACTLSFGETVAYLARRVAEVDIVVSCKDVADIYPALERLHHRPPLIERGMTVAEALAGPKHFTTRYAAASETIRAAAASRMAVGGDAVTMPRLLDTRPTDPAARAAVRAEWRVHGDEIVVGWSGAHESRRAVEAALGSRSGLRFVHVGRAPLTGRPAERQWLSALDLLVCLGTGEVASRSVAEAGSAGLAVIAQAGLIRDGHTGLVVSNDVNGIVAAIRRLATDAALRTRLGAALHARLAGTSSPEVLLPRWDALFAEVLADRTPPPPTLFRSFVQGGFECSTHRLRSGRRLDLIAATGHDTRAEGDYCQLARMGLRTFRDGVRWHLVERQPGRHDLSSFRPMAAAAVRAGAQVIWDLMHYGWPDDIDIWAPAFVDRFAAFARAAATTWRETTDEVPFWCPVNEISFLSWGGGDVGRLNPFALGRGFELKVQLARASIAAMHALRDVDPRARFVHCEPLIAVHHDPATGRPGSEAEGWHQAQFQAFDLISGRILPQIGGDPSLLDVVGVNYYSFNQWMHGGPSIDLDHPVYRPLSSLLFETYARYGRPLLIAETGVEDGRRAPWFRYVMAEVARARARGVPVEGVCLYPILNYPGWNDERDCQSGLLTQQMRGTQRGVDPALAAAVADAVATFAPSGNESRRRRFQGADPEFRSEHAGIFP